LVGREDVILHRIKKHGLRLKKGADFDIVNPEDDPRYHDYWMTYHQLMSRHGITPALAKQMVRTRPTVIASLLVHKGDADAMICGTVGRYDRHLRRIEEIIGHAPGASTLAALNVMILTKGTYFLCDAFVNPNPTAEQICDMTLMAAEEVRRFGLVPKVALLSHSDFGSLDRPEAVKMRLATQMIRAKAPDLEVDGEMTPAAALSPEIRKMLLPDSNLKGEANLLIMPNIDAANITFHMMKALGDGISVGPLLMGTAKSAHVMISSVTARGIVNAAAYACTRAQFLEKPLPGKAKSKVTKLKRA